MRDYTMRCGRCSDSGSELCNGCADIAAEVNAAFRDGQRTFWRFAQTDADEPVPFGVTQIDASHLQADFADRPYHRGWLKYSAFVTRNSALCYRLDRLDAVNRRHQERVDEAQRALDTLRAEQHDRQARREKLVQQMQTPEPVFIERAEPSVPAPGGEMAKAVIDALIKRQGNNGFCEVSKYELARELRCFQATLDDVLSALIRAGVVLREVRPGRTNRYSIASAPRGRATLRIVPDVATSDTSALQLTSS